MAGRVPSDNHFLFASALLLCSAGDLVTELNSVVGFVDATSRTTRPTDSAISQDPLEGLGHQKDANSDDHVVDVSRRNGTAESSLMGGTHSHLARCANRGVEAQLHGPRPVGRSSASTTLEVVVLGTGARGAAARAAV